MYVVASYMYVGASSCIKPQINQVLDAVRTFQENNFLLRTICVKGQTGRVDIIFLNTAQKSFEKRLQLVVNCSDFHPFYSVLPSVLFFSFQMCHTLILEKISPAPLISEYIERNVCLS